MHVKQGVNQSSVGRTNKVYHK